ncbi:MAG: zinc-dependent metalloprotease [Lapillicoccus sp.]
MSEPANEPQDEPQDRSTQYVDWAFAKTTGRRLVNPGPKVSAAEAREIVAELRRAAERAKGPIAETSRLQSPPSAPAVLIVDRPGWMDVNIESMRALVTPVIEKVTAGVNRPQSATVTAIGGKVTGAETGAVMAFLASKILGQYDLAPQGTPRLVLVAPNIVQTERELKVDPSDFRLWVAMHEETHRVQFTAVPWLRDHLVERTRDLTIDVAPTPAELAGRLQEIARRLPEAFQPGSQGLAEVLLTPEQRVKVESITAVMALLEGHADVMMDEVGPQVIPTVAHIRTRFTERRQGVSGVDLILRRVLGLEAKMRQYSDGAGFVRGVVDRAGLDAFNAVWTSPETLPTPAEIADPAAWVRRVHGS